MSGKRKLGANGAEVFPIGYGGMSFSDFYGPTDEAQSHAILDAALELGVTHLDTANVYGMGKSENAIGSYLKARPEARDIFVIATKASIARTPEGKRYFNNDAVYLEAELDKSLKRLGVDCVEVFYAHRRDPAVPVEELAESMAALVKKGKIKGYGLSEVAPSTVRRAHAVAPVAAVQNEYSLSVRLPELGLVQTCAELGIALVAFSPVGRSLLTDNPIRPGALPDNDWIRANPRFSEPNHSANIARTDKFRALAAEMGIPAAGLANAWLLAQGDHVIPIPGTRSVRHFRECVAGAHVTLTDDDLARIESVLPVGWAWGDRYGDEQSAGPERYC